MSLWQLEQFKPPQFLGFIREVPIPNTFAGQTWLPNRNVFDLDFEYILGANEQPVMAHVVAFDSEAPIAGRPAAGERVRGQLPKLSRKSRIGEKTILQFLSPRTGVPDVDEAIRTVYRDAARLVDAIQSRLEWLKLQALSEDTVVYNEMGVQWEFDYGYNDDYQLVFSAGATVDGDGTDVSGQGYGLQWSEWNSTSCNPVKDLQTICQKIQSETGVRPARFVTSMKTVGYLQLNKTLRLMVRGSTAPDAILTETELRTIFELYNVPFPTTYDVTVNQENADGSTTQVRTMAENKSFLLPPEQVGETLLGPTAESTVVLGTPFATAAPGIWGSVYATDEPPAQWTKVAATGFPTIPLANRIAQMQLWTTEPPDGSTA